MQINSMEIFSETADFLLGKIYKMYIMMYFYIKCN